MTTVRRRRAPARASGEIRHVALLLASDDASAIVHVDARFHVDATASH
jgi:hypothetical protein